MFQLQKKIFKNQLIYLNQYFWTLTTLKIIIGYLQSVKNKLQRM